ncbi:tetratricopeptide repeat-containing sensor histidine kinase [Tamlana flava]|uniref:tetratricopeptide repeat-containing sensor histidine kinase n=1 Tax=Tamlana flava TaxID=3158572 RepID=UPI00351AE3B7
MRILFLYIFCIFCTIGYCQKDSLKVKELLDIAYSYEKTSLDSSIYYYKKASELASNIKYWIGAGRGMSYAGIVFSDHGMNDSAIIYHKKSIPLYENARYPAGKASSLINLGNVFQFLGDYEKATDYYFQGIEVYEKIADTVNLTYAYGNFASLFTDFEIFEKAKYYQSKALNYSKLINDSVGAGYLLNDLGATYLNLNNKDSALVNFKKATQISENLDDDELKYYINDNLSDYYIKETDFLKALKYAKICYHNALKTKKPYHECRALKTLGLVNLKLNRIDSSFYYTQKSLDIAKKINAKEYLMDGYYLLSQTYRNQKNYKEAFTYMELYMAYKNAVLGQRKQQYITRIEQQYQLKNKDNEILRQRLTIEQNDVLIQKKRNQNGLYLIGLIIFSFTSFIFWYRHKQKQKFHAQTIETLKKQKELASLEALIEGENLERTRIAKDLHDSVNGNLSAIKHNLSSISKANLKNNEHKIFDEAIDMLDNACEQTRNISHNLVPPSLLNYGLLEAIEQYINRINSIEPVKITFQSFGTLEPLPKKIETTIYHIIQELITNIVKHSKAIKALVQITTDKTNLHITVEDDGIGYDLNEKSHGLGLQNIQSRIEFLDAEMDVQTDNKGTSVTIDIILLKHKIS